MTPDGTLDRRNRKLVDLRISLTDRCNFRCTYCMPVDAFPPGHRFLPSAAVLSAAEIAMLVRVGMRHGVGKVRLTGGEPLLRAEVTDVVAAIAGEGVADIAMTSNGSVLAAWAQRLRTAGLHRVTVSLDSLRADTVAQLSGGRGRLADILAGIAAAAAAGFAPVKLNCVVRRGINEADILPLVEFARDHGHVMRFIEFMDVGASNQWQRDEVVPAAEILATIATRHRLTPLPAAYDGEVASRHAFADGRGEVGIVASVTQPFCGACTRLRVSADGRLFTCLFASTGTDIRPLLRRGDEEALGHVIGSTWRGRDDAYSEQRAEPDRRALRPVEMSYIGG